ncbi:MAG: N-acetyl-alpha-D-glucosaminyl L-malate synthase [Anaerolineales bacterium]|nr:N-acetyl-alpha-D-glucosaminyl L-malate synthase [Anaerolineales bacterium]
MARVSDLGLLSLFMHILHVYKDYFPVLGGIENHVRLLAEAQAQRGLDVTVLVTNLSRRTTVTDENGVRVIRAGRLAHIASTPLSLAFFAQLRRLHADIVHLHFPYPPGELGNLIFQPGRRTVITYHSDVIRQQGILRAYNPVLRRALRQADRIIATSSPYIESSPYLSGVAGKCAVVPLGIDPAPFLSPNERIEQIRERFCSWSEQAGAAVEADWPLILFVGRLRYYKGLEYLLQAMRDVGATLLVVGAGPMEGEWQDMAWNGEPSEYVHFLGEVSNEALPAYYQAADVFVLPASHRSEAFGIVQLEAMAAGTPVVSTELGTGTSFVNQDGVTGFVVPPRDAGELARAINRLLADPELRQSMGERGRQRVLENFTVERMVDRIIKVYESVLG